MSLKNRKRLTTSVSNSNYNNIKWLSEITNIPQSKLMDEAINDLMGKYKSVVIDETIKEELERIEEAQRKLERE